MNNPNIANDDPSVLNIRLLVDVNPHNTADGLVVPEGQVPALQGVAHAVDGADYEPAFHVSCLFAVLQLYSNMIHA